VELRKIRNTNCANGVYCKSGERDGRALEKRDKKMGPPGRKAFNTQGQHEARVEGGKKRGGY